MIKQIIVIERIQSVYSTTSFLTEQNTKQIQNHVVIVYFRPYLSEYLLCEGMGGSVCVKKIVMSYLTQILVSIPSYIYMNFAILIYPTIQY